MTTSLAEHLLSPDHWTVEPSGCWQWTGGRSGTGYAYVSVAGRLWPAHRLVYVLTHGPLDDGLDVDHTCHNADPSCRIVADCLQRSCVNPAHLEAVTRRDNLLRGHTLPAANAAKTECPQGHPYDDQNTRRYGGRRQCVACTNARNAARRTAA